MPEEDKKEKISELKNQLNEIDAQKEAWFRKKEEYGRKIVELIKQVKDKKVKRDELTKKVKETKTIRLDSSHLLKEKISEVKALKDKLTKFSGKGKGVDPVGIKKQIEKLETRVETEVMKFDDEKKIMKEIKTLKKEFEGSKGMLEIWEKIREKSKEIDQLKKQTNSTHRLVQDQAKESQDRHEEMIQSSNEIDILKKKEEDAYKKFFEFKQKFIEVNNELKEILGEVNQQNRKLDKIKEEKKKEKKKKETIVLKDRAAEINLKIKNKEKLTTEDLLTLQQAELRKKN